MIYQIKNFLFVGAHSTPCGSLGPVPVPFVSAGFMREIMKALANNDLFYPNDKNHHNRKIISISITN